MSSANESPSIEYEFEILDIGYVYKITSKDDDKIYYGSTINWKERLRNHNSRGNKCMTRWIHGKKEISVLDTYHNISRQDLKKKERFYIENHNEDECGLLLLNKQKPGQTIQEYHKNRYAKKPNYYAEKQRDYYWKNKEKECERNRNYLARRKGDTYTCITCMELMAWTSKKAHLKSTKHLNCVAAATTTESVALEDGSVDSPTTDPAFC